MSFLELRNVPVSSVERGPLVNIASWICMVVMILAVLTRLSSKYMVTRRVGWDDAMIVSAMVCAIGEVIAISVQVTNGLGEMKSTLSPSKLDAFQRAGYASELLYVFALAFAKVSSLTFLAQLTPDKNHLAVTRAIQASVAVWAVAAVFGVAFQCNMPQPWAIITGKCFNQIAFWDAIGVLDILIDVAIVALPVYIVWSLQMARSGKAIVIGAFASRIIVIPATALRLYFIPRAVGSSDPTLNAWLYIVCTQVAVSMSIFTSCIPYLKPFMESLETGMLVSDLRRNGATTSFGYPKMSSYAMEDVTKGKKSMTSGLASRLSKAPAMRPDKVAANVTISTPGNNRTHGDRDDAESSTSTGSDKMIIKQTKEWQIHYDEQ
ncbi:MAG: hypothetical protein M4579_003703 [Chaenotheca gracillima]|nr:MAG: hypothetical protein M4579_003703 [Chaenotheca gracillima]